VKNDPGVRYENEGKRAGEGAILVKGSLLIKEKNGEGKRKTKTSAKTTKRVSYSPLYLKNYQAKKSHPKQGKICEITSPMGEGRINSPKKEDLQ